MRIEKISLISYLMIIVVIVSLSGCTNTGRDEENEADATFDLRFENINNRTVEDVVLWDILISVDDIHPVEEGYVPLWMNIRVWIQKDGASDNSYNKYKPEKYDYVPRDEWEIFYEDLTGVPGEIDIGDLFTITGVDETFENGMFLLYYGGNEAGSLRLPEEFS